MGRKVDASVSREYGLYDDPRLTAYVSDMGRNWESSPTARSSTTASNSSIPPS